METSDDLLDQRLREEVAYVDDDGFTARVVAQLPVRRERRSVRVLIIVGMALIASVIAYVMSDGGRFVAVAMAHLEQVPVWLLTASTLAAGVLVTAVGLFAASFLDRSRST